MQKFINSIAAATGMPVSGAQVQVNTYPAGLAATIYSDNGVTPAANPITTDTNGAFAFYAADGHYQIVISGANIQTQTVNDILLVDHLPADLPTTLPGVAGQVWNNGGTLSIS